MEFYNMAGKDINGYQVHSVEELRRFHFRYTNKDGVKKSINIHAVDENEASDHFIYLTLKGTLE